MDNPLVSMIMPTKNRVNFILDAVRSITAQTYGNWELIILDESSTNSTSELIGILAKFDPRIRYVKVNRPLGLAKSRNVLLKLSRGELIGHIDDDDLLHENALETMVKEFENDKELAMAYSDSFVIDEAGRVIGEKISPDFHKNNLINLGFNHFGMYRKNIADMIGGFNEKVWCEDGDLFMRIAKNFRCKRVPGFLYYYRSHSTNFGHKRPVCKECDRQDVCNYYKIWNEENNRLMKNSMQALP